MIIGEKLNIKAYKYSNGDEEEVTDQISENQEKIFFNLNENDQYEFKLNIGKNFYFIISQEIGSEKFLITN